MTAKTIIDKALSYLYTYDNGTNEVIFNDRYYGKHVTGNSYPWCCAFVWCIFEECGASDLFYDGKKTAYCPTVHQWGREKGIIVPTSEGQYGDIVLFDWNGDGVADHIGFIISRNGNGTYETVEGNTATYNYTNGGYVLKMTRYYSSIIAIIRPQYDDGKKGVKTDMKNGKFIIDVSQHQGNINWDKVKDKISGAIIRCGYGDDIASQDDTQYARNLSECERLGIPYGVYLYSYATTELQAKSELAHFLRLIDGHKPVLGAFLDVEERNTEQFCARACRVVCDGLKKAGFTPGVYSSLSWWNSYLTEIKEYTRWVAHWNSFCAYGGEYLIWQYGTEKVDGINGEVDANYYYGDFGKSDKTTSTTTAANTTENKGVENTTKKAVPDITYQVFTDTSGWLPVVRNLEDYAGVDGQPIKGIRVFLNGDTLAVQTHQMSDGSIDKLTIFAGKNTIRYRVRVVGASDYYSWMENKKDTGGSSDTFAGEVGKAIDRVQIIVK